MFSYYTIQKKVKKRNGKPVLPMKMDILYTLSSGYISIDFKIGGQVWQHTVTVTVRAIDRIQLTIIGNIKINL